MGNYEHPVYLNEVEAEELQGILAAYCSDEDGHEHYHGLDHIREQLDRILNG